jgi:ornithine cyclodeaminase/alanine dehydrogenase-like protein (mu-crystallin family)
MLFINNDDVQTILTMEDALRVLEDGHGELAKMELVARPRVDIYTETPNVGAFHRWGTMEGSSKGLQRHAIRMKSDIVSWRDHGGGRVEDKYCMEPGLFCGLIHLFDTSNGEPLAIINDGYLQHIRVGALAGLGVKYLAKSDTPVLGMLGAGGMARSHLMAFAAVRKIQRVQVYSPTQASRALYAKEMAELIGVEVVPCKAPEDVARDADILATCTNSIQPTVHSEMISPGMHLTKVSGEWAPDVYPRIDVAIGSDPLAQVVQGVPIDGSQGFTTYLAGNVEALREAMGPGRRRDATTEGGRRTRGRGEEGFTGRITPLAGLISGSGAGRESDDEVSASGGVVGSDGKQGLQFVTVSSLVYDLAKQAGLGREIPTEWFTQDIRD